MVEVTPTKRRFEDQQDYYRSVYETFRTLRGFREVVNPRTNTVERQEADDQVIVRLADNRMISAKPFLAAELITKGEARLTTDEEFQAYHEGIAKECREENARRAARELKVVATLAPSGSVQEPEKPSGRRG